MRISDYDLRYDEDAVGVAGDDAPVARALLAAGTEDDTTVLATLSMTPQAAPEAAVEPDAAQILRDRPDVFAAYYRDYYSPLNDRHSDAWVDRVGGTTAEDYARYWFRTHGVAEGYAPRNPVAGAPLEDAGTTTGRTTLDGIPLSRILSDRPDVFQAFFTEYYGPNNDRHSDAWVQRVGGTTVEDYANYWYNAHGKLEGYRPSVAAPPASPATTAPDDAGATDGAGSTSPPAMFDPTTLDPWNHPALYPDWVLQHPQDPPTVSQPGGDAATPSSGFVYSDDLSPMFPAGTLLTGETTLFDADAI